MKAQHPLHNQFKHPEWSSGANIYEVNLRQYTKEGTFNAFEKELSRLTDMGIKILWFMPVNPIGFKDRHGELGSYYAVRDYKDSNPEFGTVEDFKHLVKEVHGHGMKVIVDFVGNHTANDHPWIKGKPHYYVYQENGDVLHPHGWDDVAQLNFEEREVWEVLIDAMLFWVKECDVDGFRCDMAHLVPLELWREARQKTEEVKPGQFWLGECEVAKYHEVFDATYTWMWMHASEDFCKGKLGFDGLLKTLYRSDVEFAPEAFRAYFTSNHDENSWNGTEYEKYGEAAHLFAVLSCTWRGIPMLYSGQELPNLKRLKFFDKDPIDWSGEYKLHNFYKTLLALKKNNPALSAERNAVTTILTEDSGTGIFTYLRKNGDDAVLTVLNLSDEHRTYHVPGVQGTFRNVFGGPDVSLDNGASLEISAKGYLVFEKIKIKR